MNIWQLKNLFKRRQGPGLTLVDG